MPDVIFAGPSGRLEGRFSAGAEENAPIALILHAHPKMGGTMQDPVSLLLYQSFAARNFSVLRFNFRGVGKSQGSFDAGHGELADAASAVDWMQQSNPTPRAVWVAGHSFGAWIALQLLMRRPEIDGFIAVAPPANFYDLSFLAPCPSSGVILHGSKDQVTPPADMERIVSKIRTQKNILVENQIIDGANHFFADQMDPLRAAIEAYLDRRLK